MHWTARVVHFEIAKNANNLPAARVLRKVDPEVLADGVLIGKEPLHKCLVDHRHLWRSGRIPLRKSAPAHHRHANGIQEMRAHPVPRRAAMRVGAWSRMTLLDHALAPVVAV